MMRAFPGFPDRAATTRIPTLWLRAVLAEAESLAELKVTLHALRLLDTKRTYPRYVRTSELRADATTVASLQATGGLSEDDALGEGVRLAVARGVFLALPVSTVEGEPVPTRSRPRRAAEPSPPLAPDIAGQPEGGASAGGPGGSHSGGAGTLPGGGLSSSSPGGAGALPCRGDGGVSPQASSSPPRIEGLGGPSAPPRIGGLGGPHPDADLCLFLNTPAHRQLVARLARGEQRLELGPAPPPAVLPARRPTIFELYEQNVGLLTPLLVEELREAAETYPPDWLEEAFREAVGYNRRHWRYVRRILEKWATEGRGDRGVAGGRPQAPRDSRRYLEGRYGHLIQH
jgi:DnaD/phage-associated family protein